MLSVLQVKMFSFCYYQSNVLGGYARKRELNEVEIIRIVILKKQGVLIEEISDS